MILLQLEATNMTNHERVRWKAQFATHGGPINLLRKWLEVEPTKMDPPACIVMPGWTEELCCRLAACR